jgi:hypothetical protein
MIRLRKLVIEAEPKRNLAQLRSYSAKSSTDFLIGADRMTPITTCRQPERELHPFFGHVPQRQVAAEQVRDASRHGKAQACPRDVSVRIEAREVGEDRLLLLLGNSWTRVEDVDRDPSVL